MSAGGLSYDCIRGSTRKVTLPSVESWGTNMNILKDPPKALYTRKIDKVGSTQEILYMDDDSGDRICEMINLYPRGVNPSVSVSYSNYGTNGGQNRLAVGNESNCCAKGITTVGQQAKLPYRVDIQGSFRPPIRTEFDLKPLSRLPRIWTYAFANPAMPKFMGASQCDVKETDKAIKENIINNNVVPNAVYHVGGNNIGNPEYQVKNMVINDPIKVEGFSGMRTMDITSRNVLKPTKEVNENYEMTMAQSQLGSQNITKSGENQVDMSKYIIDDPNYSNITSNISSNLHVTPLENLSNNNRVVLKDPLHVNHSTDKRGYNQTLNISKDMELSRSLPAYSSHTNNVTSLQKILESDNMAELERNRPIAVGTTNMSGTGDTNVFKQREFNYLPKKNSRGGFLNQGIQPQLEREDLTSLRSGNQQKNILGKKAYNSYAERFGTY